MEGREGHYSTARALNLDAGDYPISTDPQELGAAARAADRSWEEFPYYELRYDGRGRLFGRSDSGWLITLCDADPRYAVEQVHWLGRVLASRGMPQWLLERHLFFLHEELARTFPANAARYAILREAAESLRETRRAHLSEARFQALGRRFRALAGEELSRRIPEAGYLLASAVADESAGIRGAVASLEPWMTDPGRFPADWIAAVHTVLEEARVPTPPARRNGRAS